MPIREHIAKRYALSLFNAALEHNKVNEVYSDITKLNSIITRDDYCKRILLSPVVPIKIKEKVLQLVLDQYNTHKLTKSFWHVLIKKNRSWCWNMVYSHYKQLLQEHKGELNVIVESATKLDEAISQKISDYLEKKLHKTIILENKISSDLLGGMILKWHSKMLDCSLQTKLNEMKQLMLSAKIKV